MILRPRRRLRNVAAWCESVADECDRIADEDGVEPDRLVLVHSFGVTEATPAELLRGVAEALRS